MKLHHNSEVTIVNIPGVDLKPNSVSNFTLLDNGEGTYFRIQTSKCMTPAAATSLFDYNAKNTSYSPCVTLGESTSLVCKSCRACVTGEPLCFQRILPLPSDSWDASDMFCHAHHGDTEVQCSIQPKRADLLYGAYNFILSQRYVTLSNVNMGRRVVSCDQCEAWLGTKHGESHITLWNSTVEFRPVRTGNAKEVLNDKTSAGQVDSQDDDCGNEHSNKRNIASTVKANIQDTALSDFICVVKENIGINSKILIQCQVSEQSEQYLLLWIMDRNLSVFTWEGQEGTVYNVMKVLYTYAKDKPDPSWSKDFSLAHINVSKIMFLNALKHIRVQAKNIPTPYRFISDMHVSYIVLG
ncbi:hypothetical protein M8J75_009995 [Diaphorina citri]|nr:hypothetical protein M8J75_009995 [Diaphorina citri]KAI5743225.1 hypothetical protein M8J77_015883 [Diaphorina citri]